jgi:hypothetical protein
MARMIRMTAVKTPSPYRRRLWMVCIRYVDGTVGACQPVDSPKERGGAKLAPRYKHIVNPLYALRVFSGRCRSKGRMCAWRERQRCALGLQFAVSLLAYKLFFTFVFVFRSRIVIVFCPLHPLVPSSLLLPCPYSTPYLIPTYTYVQLTWIIFLRLPYS